MNCTTSERQYNDFIEDEGTEWQESKVSKAPKAFIRARPAPKIYNARLMGNVQ